MIKSKCSGKKKLSVKMGPSEYKIDGENYFIVDLELDKNEMTMSVWGAKKKGTPFAEGPKYFGEATVTMYEGSYE